MGKYDKEYDAFQIFEQIQEQSIEEASQAQPQQKRNPASGAEAPYYEIEYDSGPLPGVGRFVLKSDKIQAPPAEEDPVRKKYYQMRDVARECGALTFNNSKFYDKRIQQESARLFYKQGMFLKDFQDSCERKLPYLAYFPNYQMLGYGQFRTYFSWRSQVRQGDIHQTSLSYAFLYLYELLNNIGVESPREGLERLLLFWEAYRVYDASIDKYLLKWLKDYHVYYELPWSFREFVQQNKLEEYYPELSESEDPFEVYCKASKYDVRKSNFYTKEHIPLIKDCFLFVLEQLRDVFAQNRMDLEEAVFQPARNATEWTPFQKALFYPAFPQADRRVMLSKKEIYLCRNNRWTFSKTVITDSGKRLIGYCMKQMESVLRRLTKYKHKLSATPDSLDPAMTGALQKSGLRLEAIVTSATEAFYREATKTVVRVDSAVLEKIRQEALTTQERLLVPEETQPPQAAGLEAPAAPGAFAAEANAERTQLPQAAGPKAPAAPGAFAAEANAERTQPPHNEWADLRNALTEIERQALARVVGGDSDLKKFADANGFMPEVLMDGINEKSMDCVGDSILDDGFVIYDDYIDQVKEMVESL